VHFLGHKKGNVVLEKEITCFQILCLIKLLWLMATPIRSQRDLKF